MSSPSSAPAESLDEYMVATRRRLEAVESAILSQRSELVAHRDATSKIIESLESSRSSLDASLVSANDDFFSSSRSTLASSFNDPKPSLMMDSNRVSNDAPFSSVASDTWSPLVTADLASSLLDSGVIDPDAATPSTKQVEINESPSKSTVKPKLSCRLSTMSLEDSFQFSAVRNATVRAVTEYRFSKPDLAVEPRLVLTSVVFLVFPVDSFAKVTWTAVQRALKNPNFPDQVASLSPGSVQPSKCSAVRIKFETHNITKESVLRAGRECCDLFLWIAFVVAYAKHSLKPSWAIGASVKSPSSNTSSPSLKGKELSPVPQRHIDPQVEAEKARRRVVKHRIKLKDRETQRNAVVSPSRCMHMNLPHDHDAEPKKGSAADDPSATGVEQQGGDRADRSSVVETPPSGAYSIDSDNSNSTENDRGPRRASSESAACQPSPGTPPTPDAAPDAALHMPCILQVLQDRSDAVFLSGDFSDLEALALLATACTHSHAFEHHDRCSVLNAIRLVQETLASITAQQLAASDKAKAALEDSRASFATIHFDVLSKMAESVVEPLLLGRGARAVFLLLYNVKPTAPDGGVAWATASALLRDAELLKKLMMEFNPTNVTPALSMAVNALIEDPLFCEAYMLEASPHVSQLCSWVISVVTYQQICNLARKDATKVSLLNAILNSLQLHGGFSASDPCPTLEAGGAAGEPAVTSESDSASPGVVEAPGQGETETGVAVKAVDAGSNTRTPTSSSNNAKLHRSNSSALVSSPPPLPSIASPSSEAIKVASPLLGGRSMAGRTLSDRSIPVLPEVPVVTTSLLSSVVSPPAPAPLPAAVWVYTSAVSTRVKESSDAVVAWLTSWGIPFVKVDLMTDPVRRAEMKGKSGKMTPLPQIFVNDVYVDGGLAELKDMVEKGVVKRSERGPYP